MNYLVHGRYLPGPASPRLVAELIRASDGVHVWVNAFDPGEEPGTIVDMVTDALTDLSS